MDNQKITKQNIKNRGFILLSTLFIIALLTALGARLHHQVMQHTQLTSLSARQISKQAAAFDNILSLEREINKNGNYLRYCLPISDNLTLAGSLYRCPSTTVESAFTHKNGLGRTYWTGEKILSDNCRKERCQIISRDIGSRTFIEELFRPEQPLTFNQKTSEHLLIIRNHADISAGMILNENAVSEIISAGDMTYDPRTIYMAEGSQLILKSEFGSIYEKQNDTSIPKGKQIAFPEGAIAETINLAGKNQITSMTID
ncbi:MAG: hypothetical protein PHC51_02085 [bacterium]|nr:hypothetical protein [bacterium]